MNIALRCRCGPKHSTSPIRAHLVDAPRAQPARTDPTGTLAIQKKFDKEFDLRWTRVRKMIPQAVSLRMDQTNVFSHAMMTGNDPVKAFQAWLDETLRQLKARRARHQNH